MSQRPPTPVDAAKKYVEYMGGTAAMIASAQKDYDAGNYRWVAEAMKQAVFAEPENAKAKGLLADPSLKVWEVGEQAGFTDATHFSRTFKKLTGMSANEYRSKS